MTLANRQCASGRFVVGFRDTINPLKTERLLKRAGWEGAHLIGGTVYVTAIGRVLEGELALDSLFLIERELANIIGFRPSLTVYRKPEGGAS